jgi:polyribonucleotide nucleotidyltransferase
VRRASKASYDAALGLVEASTATGAKVGDSVTAKVVQVRDFGVILQLPSGEQGLLHISEVSHERLAKMEGVFQLDEAVTVQVVAKDPKGSLRLSRKALLEPPPLLGQPAQRDRPPFDRSRLGRGY